MVKTRAHLEQEPVMNLTSSHILPAASQPHRRQSMLATVFVALVLMTSLSGCAGLLLGAAATAGVAAFDERGIKQVALDTQTSTNIRGKLFNRTDDLFQDIGVEVHEGRVLMTGRVPNEQMRADAIKIAWSVENVADVINEINVSENPLSDLANDSWITTKLKSKMTFDGDVLAINYAIETVGGVIYLIGIAQNKVELDRVLNHARDVSYVKRVVSHMRIKDPEVPKENKADKDKKAS